VFVCDYGSYQKNKILTATKINTIEKATSIGSIFISILFSVFMYHPYVRLN